MNRWPAAAAVETGRILVWDVRLLGRMEAEDELVEEDEVEEVIVEEWRLEENF